MVLNKLLRSGQGAFTLVEMVIYMAVLSFIIVLITDMFVGIIHTKIESESTSAVEMDSQLILNRLRYDISRATQITTPAAIGSTSPSLAIQTPTGNYQYTLSGESLKLLDSTGLSNLTSTLTRVKSLSFTKIANSSVTGTKDTIQVILTIESVAQSNGRSEVRTFQTTLGRRE